jgi:hypothetical protein
MMCLRNCCMGRRGVRRGGLLGMVEQGERVVMGEVYAATDAGEEAV